jgi:hypothetical protein
MLRKNTLHTVLLLLLALSALLLLVGPSGVQAGIYRASGEVTYKEYWVPHTQFTGGCHPGGPGIGQTGEQTITFIASDGAVQSSMAVKVTVTGVGIALPMIIGSD